VDVFFLISYSGNSRFHDGIVIYSIVYFILPRRSSLIYKVEDDHHIEKILAKEVFKGINLLPPSSKPTNTPASTTEQKTKDINLLPTSSESTNTPTPTTLAPITPAPTTEQTPTEQKTTEQKTTEQKTKYATFSRDTFFYIVTSIGHRIGLQTTYKTSDLKRYTIHLRKHQDPLLKRKYKNALKHHDTLDMIQDAMKLGLVSYAEVLGHGLSHIYRGGSTLDVGKGFVGGISASKERKWAGLSGDKA
jgi:hypothetical protein